MALPYNVLNFQNCELDAFSRNFDRITSHATEMQITAQESVPYNNRGFPQKTGILSKNSSSTNIFARAKIFRGYLGIL